MIEMKKSTERCIRAERILDQLTQACYELDEAGIVVFVNKRAVHLFRKQEEEVLGSNIWEVFPESRNTLCYNAIQLNALQNKKPAKYEYISAVTHTWISLEAIPTVEGCLVLFTEIEELRQARSRYQELIENIPDVITRWNKDLKLIYANKALELKTGVPNDQLIGKDKQEMGFPDDVALPWMEGFKKAFSTGREISHYSTMPTSGGDVYFHSRIIPEKNKRGEVESVMSIDRDISALKQTEQQLNKVNERLALKNSVHAYAEEIASMGSWTWNPLTNEALYSDNMFRLFGMEPNEVEPSFETIPRFIHPEDRQKVMDVISEVNRSREASVEYRVIRKDGHERIFQNRMKLVETAKGEQIFVGLTKDVTEQKRRNLDLQTYTEQLKENKEFIEHVTNTMSEIISVVEVQSGKLVYSNRQPTEMTGYTTEEIRQMGIQDLMSILVHPDDRQALENYYNRLEALKDNSTVEVKYRFCKKGGGIFWFHVKGQVLRRDVNGRPTHTLHIGNDITEQKKAEEQAKEQLHFINKVTTMLPDMLSVIRLEDREITYANKEPFELNGFSAEDIRRMSVKERQMIIHEEDRTAMKEYFNSYYTSGEGETREMEYRALTNKGTWEWFRVRGKVFKRDEEGKPTYCVNIVQNINARKIAQQELVDLRLHRQKEVLNAIILAQEQERERIGEALHNGVAQLLYAIKTRLQMIEPSDDKQLKEAMDIVTEAINETKKISFELVPAVLKDHGIEVALRSLFQRIVGNNLLIEFNLRGKGRFAENIEFAVYRITQELMNNCIKHASATRVWVEITQKEQMLHLEVKDNGIGFDEEKLNPENKGIGLQSVRNRISLLGGKLKIDSSEKGTTIHVELPLK
jgi:PAS domain S-box-containing protein